MRIRPVGDDHDWEHARAIRTRVFVEEQSCPPEEEWDAYDETSRHFLGVVDGQAAATARWRTVPYAGRLVAKLERVAVLPDFRGRGYGRQLVAALIDDAHRAGFDTCVLHAQAHLEEFYRSFGFETVGEPFYEAGIRHIKMVRTAPPAH